MGKLLVSGGVQVILFHVLVASDGISINFAGRQSLELMNVQHLKTGRQ